jgi:hypothetical protein
LSDITCAKPRGASIACSELSKPASASSADISPFCAARPGWKLFVIVPNISRRPEDCVAARPSAQRIRCSESPIAFPTAAAAPKTPVVPVMCQPRS